MRASRALASLTALLAVPAAWGCATLETRAPVAGQPPHGIRVYPPRVYLLVDTCARKSRIALLPDFENAYDVKPLTLLAEQEFGVEVVDGQLAKLTANQDTTALLTFLRGAAETAAKAAGAGVSGTSIDGTFGLDDGVWTLGPGGAFAPLQTRPDRACP